MNQKEAKKRVTEIREYYTHLITYAAVNVFLIAINLITTPGFFWFIFPMLGWGIGIAIHTFTVFGTGREWEARKMEELTGLKETKDEIHRLTERADALVSILASVDWDKIDPELLQTRDKLEEARDKITTLDRGDRQTSTEDVNREIEKLEEFVTSSKFEYYDKAARD